jgi:hypothetical protein
MQGTGNFWRGNREEKYSSYAPTRDRNEGGGAPSSSIAISKPDSDPWAAKVLFGSLLTVLIVSEAVLFSGFATVSETWP